MTVRAPGVTSPDRTTIVAFGVIVVLGGLNGLAVKASNLELAPFWGATLRFAAATLILLAIVGLRGIPLPRRRALAGSILYGVLNFAVFFGLLYWALVEAPAGLAMIILALAPLLTLLLAAILGLERLRPHGVAGAVLALSGIAVVFGDRVGTAVPFGSALAVVGGATAIAASSVVVKRFPRVHPVANNAVAMAVGAALLLGLSIVAGEPWTLQNRFETWAAIGYLVALGSVTMFVLFVFVIGRWTASATSYAVLLMPLVTVPVATLVADEAVTAAYVAGGVIVLVGVYVGAFGPSFAWLFQRARLAAGASPRAGAAGAELAVEPVSPPPLASPGCP